MNNQKSVTISGSFRKFAKEVGRARNTFIDLGVRVLSPVSADVVYSVLRAEVAKRTLIETVRTSNKKILSTELKDEDSVEVVEKGREEIMQEVTKLANEKAAQYGIEILDVRIKRADLPKANEDSIYGRMIEERNRISRKYESEGKRESTKIKAEADKQVEFIKAEAYRNSQRIRGEGDSEAMKIYAHGFVIEDGARKGEHVSGYKEDPTFYEFVRSLEALEKSADGKTKFILSTKGNLYEALHNQDKR